MHKFVYDNADASFVVPLLLKTMQKDILTN